tara:strand:+ start:541 stop:2532 length:1992 start_codon:yes stop_codon:yes gene_type:complete
MKMMQQQQPLGLSLEHMGMEEDAVPFGSLEHEVADDLPVLLSEGEYVVPADVVRYWGLKHLEEMRTQAKCGLMYMEMDGRLQQVDNVDDDDEDAVVADYEDVEVLEVSADDIDEEMSDLGIDQEEEVDFDGKEPIKMQLGGSPTDNPDLDRNPGNLTFGAEITNPGLYSSGPPNRSMSDIVDGLLGAAVSRASKNTSGVRGLAATPSLNEIMSGTVTPDQMAGVVGKAAISAASPPAFGGPLASAFGLGPTIDSATDLGFTIGNKNVAINLGTGFPGLMGAKATRDIAEIIGKIARNDPTVSKDDVSLTKDGQVIAVQRGWSSITNGPTAQIIGTVPPGFGVKEYNDMLSLSKGKVASTVSLDSKTGIPQFDKATDLVGQTTDPDTGATVAGYDPNTGNAQTSEGVSASGTLNMAIALSDEQIDDINSMRSSFNQIDKEAVQKERNELVGTPQVPDPGETEKDQERGPSLERDDEVRDAAIGMANTERDVAARGVADAAIGLANMELRDAVEAEERMERATWGDKSVEQTPPGIPDPFSRDVEVRSLADPLNTQTLGVARRDDPTQVAATTAPTQVAATTAPTPEEQIADMVAENMELEVAQAAVAEAAAIAEAKAEVAAEDAGALGDTSETANETASQTEQDAEAEAEAEAEFRRGGLMAAA